MKLLILTVSTGQGHNSAGAAISDEFSKNGFECETVDVFQNYNRFLGKAMSEGYLLSVSTFSGMYAKSYSKLEKRKRGSKSFIMFLCKLIASRLAKKIKQINPDIIVCTHVFAAMALSYALKKSGLSPLTAAVVTDFTVHPYWEEVTYLDYLITASELLNRQCEEKGFRPSQILPIGIPIHAKFSVPVEKSIARKELGLDIEENVITVMSGSMCYGGLSEQLKEIDTIEEKFSIIAVCGSSKEELKKINEINFAHSVLKLGYTDKMNLIMDASDCIITKPGGLSVSEALSKDLPMIIANVIPGHEQRNLEFLTANNLAIEVKNGNSVKDCIKKFLKDDSLKKTMRESAERIGKKNAAGKLYEILSSEAVKRNKNGKF